MDYYETYKDLPENARGCIVVVGNFDGVHLGHKALLERARVLAKKQNRKVAALTFEPHPRQLFRGEEPFRRITPHALKVKLLKQCGADIVFSLPFNWAFASQPPNDFVQEILVQGLAAAHVVIGYDFRFGQLRQGDAKTIRDAGIEVTTINKVTGDGQTGEISSSHVRQCLQDGMIEKANAILGWAWEIHGLVVKHNQLGRKLGYPTANMDLGETFHPAYGVYACRARLIDEDYWFHGVANIGIRPMFEVKTALIETHIFDFTRDIYGRTLRIRPIKRIRGEAMFETLDKLVEQIGKDCSVAKEILNAGNSG